MPQGTILTVKLQSATCAVREATPPEPRPHTTPPHAPPVPVELLQLIMVLPFAQLAALVTPAAQLKKPCVPPGHIPLLDPLSARSVLKESTHMEVLLSARIAKPGSIARKALQFNARAGSGQPPKHPAAPHAKRGTLALQLHRQCVPMAVTL